MTNSNFTYNDGGRAASGRKGSTGDCGVRAIRCGAEFLNQTLKKC